ncbi:hypothetical protein Cgig2_008012 [Carnegiea gigantea]|uniref:Fungal lipase-type domain-containing protein n=1 Tax=Carnegiea gigantea TaxID=171969 RepID=A0A9Q1L0V4_9CARY|nr:hypothetical protein Cgig2_008012 [Carnegiea gigantea]
MVTKDFDTHTNKFLHLNNKNVTFRKLGFQLLFGGYIKDSSLIYHNIPQEKENKHLHRFIIYLSLAIQVLLSHISKPLSILGHFLEAVLNPFKVTSVIHRGNVDKKSASYFSFLGHLDSRTELDRKIEHGDGRYYPALTMMASKLAYENQNVIKSVVSDHWKMEFMGFYDFYNEFQEIMATQAFIFQERGPENDTIIVSFRGTSPFVAHDWSTDFDISWCKFKGVGKAHMGFMTALGLKKYRNNDHPAGDYDGYWPNEVEQDPKFPLAYYTIREMLREIIKKNKKARFIVTGHSLGAALAILFPAILAMHDEGKLLDRLEGVYTYGQPRVGDEKFGKFVMKKLREHDIKYYRIVYANDVVPAVPFDNSFMMFKHFGIGIHFNSLYCGKVGKDLILSWPSTYCQFKFLVVVLEQIIHIVEEEIATLKRKQEARNVLEKWLWVLRDIAGFIANFILARLNAVFEVIRGFIIPYTAGRDFKEGWLLIVFRLTGILLPGAANHGPQDYVNATRLASKDLFLHYTSLMSDQKDTMS